MNSLRPSRGEVTRQALLRAAVHLFAEQGVENTTVRDILAAAGQKNESALHYHFGGYQGLIEAAQKQWNDAVRIRRGEMLAAWQSAGEAPCLRTLCRIMVQPAFELAASDTYHRDFVRAFGHAMALGTEPALRLARRTEDESGRTLGNALRAAMPGLDAFASRHRLEIALRMCAAAMHHHAGQRSAFRGKPAQIFLLGLLDALEALLAAPESGETRAARSASGMTHQ
ncbi:MAG: TetR family transcriptional regulator [Pseudomonadales bacterium]|nr:TetR family transcriptional regulator [Pseudomonadales bacterium]